MIKQHDFAFKWILYAAATLLVSLIQYLILNHIWIMDIHPFLAPILVSIVISLEGFSTSFGYALIYGLWCDLTIPGPIPCFYTFVFFIIAVLTGIGSTKVVMPGTATSLVHGALAILITDLFQIIFLLPTQSDIFPYAFQLFAIELLLSVIFSPLLYVFMRFIHRKTTLF